MKRSGLQVIKGFVREGHKIFGLILRCLSWVFGPSRNLCLGPLESPSDGLGDDMGFLCLLRLFSKEVRCTSGKRCVVCFVCKLLVSSL